MLKHTLIAVALATAVATPAGALQVPAPPAAADEYAPVAWLVGDWISDENGNRIRQSFRWGPRNAYIFYSTYTAMNGRPEALHFEGIFVWNGRTKAYDYVFAIEPGSGGQEKGAIMVQPDGSLVREVELTTASGQTGRFRQTFRQTAPAEAITSLMRQSGNGWVPNFPGSERIVMRRSPGS